MDEAVERFRRQARRELGDRQGAERRYSYMLERWEGLTRFMNDPRIPLDNNAAERALRGPVVGRKNHYGSRSIRGTQVAALFYTLCETARLVEIDPHAYLLRAVEAAITTPGAITLPEALLPEALRSTSTS